MFLVLLLRAGLPVLVSPTCLNDGSDFVQQAAMTAFSKAVTIAFAVTAKTRTNVSQRRGRQHNVPPPPRIGATPGPQLSSSNENTDAVDLTDLCSIMNVTSPHDLLALLVDPVTGIRGVHANRPVDTGHVLLKVPLSSCLMDSKPPKWLQPEHDGITNLQHPSQWATRLAACVLDLPPGRYKDLLPDAAQFRATLPIHWAEDVLVSAQCAALELAVDSAYFARAQAVADLMDGLVLLASSDEVDMDDNGVVRKLKQQCDYALDIVQTRTCRLMEPTAALVGHGGHPVRVLAPIFDFINHAGTAANACFQQEGDYLVVRAKKDIGVGTEVFIDYGESAKPSWKCLFSYGFLGGQKTDDSVAEVYLDGVRYEVGPSRIPYELVEAEDQFMKQNGLMTGNTNADELTLTPLIALSLAKRLSDIAFQLVLHQPCSKGNDDNTEEDPENVIAEQLAASLRWCHHRTLLDCAIGLRDWAAGGESPDLTGISP